MALLVQHILRHPSGRVSFRRQYPPELRPFISQAGGSSGPVELKVSLGHEGSSGFLSRYEAALLQWDSTVAEARRRHAGEYDRLDAPTIAYLAKLFEVRWLEKDESDRWEKGEIHSHRVQAGLEWELDDFRRWRAEGDADAIDERWTTAAQGLLQERNLVLAPGDLDGLSQLCRALNDTAINIASTLEGRLRGEVIPTPPEPPLPAREVSRHVKAPAGSRVPLLALYDAYAAANGGMTAGVRVEWRKYIERLIGFLGHEDARRLTAMDLRAWRDLLLSETTRKGTLRSPVTVHDKYLTSVRAALAYGVEEGLLRENVASAVKVKKPKKAKVRERSFSASEAHAILSAALSPVSKRTSPEFARARRWVPWLCAYTGARVGEIAQLRGQDVIVEDGVQCLRITPEAGTVKTKEFRLVPVHPHLIEQGFVDVVRASGPGPLFYDPTRQRVNSEGNRHVKKVGEKIGSWVREEVGINDPNLQPNHGWRHLFKERSYECVEERKVDALQGHAPTTTGRGYAGPSIRAKAEAIARFPRFEVNARADEGVEA